MGDLIVIDKDLDFLLWQEFRMLRLDLAKQPEFLREKIMEYEERLLFMLIEDGVIHDIIESIRRRPVILVTKWEEIPGS